MYLTMEQLEKAARLYCKRTGQDPDELILDALTMEKTLPRWEKIRDRMAGYQFEMQAMADVATPPIQPCAHTAPPDVVSTVKMPEYKDPSWCPKC